MSLIPSLWGRRSSPVYDPFSLDVWDRFQLFDPSISKDIAKPSTDFARDAAAIANTQIDWKETPDAHVFKADLPGLKKEEVKIEVEDGRILQISGERSKEEEQKNEKYHRIERSRGRFLRRFRLPENAKVDEVKAGMENGVLTVTVPKQPQPQPEVKSIEISG
ncbi:17.8 kDa class I heat shock protein [Cryptomeria japonica]|uniref:17.8 kDa class I heat shock protein n=1 Tax=Cryptomeria japonica TaxID=3369 RepID=UPI0025AD8318|nr:17.8 kDa class I heat shock protein [Cryptomeria japonica]XP_057855564.1 17.8 kDa class I heat shock protein [Cryptomeria japonica]